MSRSMWSLATIVSALRRPDPRNVRTSPRTSYASGPVTGPVSQFRLDEAAGPNDDVQHPKRRQRRAVLGNEPGEGGELVGVVAQILPHGPHQQTHVFADGAAVLRRR